MFLHEGQVVAGSKPLPYLSKMMDGILYPLWDLGLKVGHSVRSRSRIACRSANSDMQSKTSLIEARLIAGDEELFEKLQKAVVAKCVRGLRGRIHRGALGGSGGAAREIRQLRHACRSRTSRTAAADCAIFRTCSGWRFSNIARGRWRRLETARIDSARRKRKQLEAAYDFLLRVRNELHYHIEPAGGCAWARTLQPAVAHNLGYTDRSPSKRLEKFMRDVYTHCAEHLSDHPHAGTTPGVVAADTKKLPSVARVLCAAAVGQAEASRSMDGFKIHRRANP